MKNILCINAGGIGAPMGEIRVNYLTKDLNYNIHIYNIDKKKSRFKSFKEIWKLINSQKWDLIYQEMTSISGGINLILSAIIRKQKYIISTGDPVSGFFKITKGKIYGIIFELYERLLYRYCYGFIGWTPYLTGRAIKMNAKRAVTIEGAVDLNKFYPFSKKERIAAKKELGLNLNHIICGVVGSFKWNRKQKYCYGLELVELLKYIKRKDISILLVGEGNGKKILEKRIPKELKSRIIFTGKIDHDKVIKTINAMDIGFITQTLDCLGNYRLTTKLPEYLACGVPVAMSPVPGFYDYASEAGWALPKFHPANKIFHLKCANWLDNLTWKEIHEKAANSRKLAEKYFDYKRKSEKFRIFVEKLLENKL